MSALDPETILRMPPSSWKLPRLRTSADAGTSDGEAASHRSSANWRPFSKDADYSIRSVLTDKRAFESARD